MLINSDLAQRIVNSTMSLVNRNVNIMNREGVIIATGHPHRKNTFHKGAKDVIETGMVIEIYPDQLDQYPGALQGINLPIVLEEQVVGVIGVFGVPDEVRDTGKLVKTITELILERELLQEETRSRYRLREQFLETALSVDATSALPKIKRLGKSLNINLSLPRSISVTNVGPFIKKAVSGYGSSELVLERSIEAILTHIDHSGLLSEQDLAVVWDEHLIMLKSFPASWQPNSLQQWGESLMKSLQGLSPEITCCGSGMVATAVIDYSTSYQQALFCLGKCHPPSRLRTIYDRELLVGFTFAKSTNSVINTALEPLAGKFQHYLCKKSEGRKTIETLLSSNLNLSNAAKLLHLHRNTLMFRLNQFQNITGLDPAHNFEDAVLCRILLDTIK